MVEEDQEINAEEVVEVEDDDKGVDYVYFDGVFKTVHFAFTEHDDACRRG